MDAENKVEYSSLSEVKNDSAKDDFPFDLLSKLNDKTAYTRLPPALHDKIPDWPEKNDLFGMEDRVSAIKHVLSGRDMGEILDIGGYIGYFPLCLIDSGMADHALVYDLKPDALAAGRALANLMHVGDKIDYVEKTVDIESLDKLPEVGTIICQNVLHHAPKRFDRSAVE